MKRLIITGLPCPPQAWEKLFGHPKGQRIIPMVEVFENTDSPDLREMSRYVAQEIERFKPTSIVAHDLGVPLALLSLIRLQRRGRAPQVKLTLFNGAFRKIDVLKAPHPFRVQWMSMRRAIREVESQGGTVDLRLKPYMSRIRAMYRLIILYSLAEKVQSILGLENIVNFSGRSLTRIPVQVIGSPNDPYIPFTSVEQLRKDFGAKRFVEVNYGHFPYSVAKNRIAPLVEEFETSH